jgi:hypothetical protein
MAHVNRALVVELLADGSLSYREIARQAQCSDWSVRAIANELASDDSAVCRFADSEPLSLRDWGICVAVLAAFLGGVWLLWRQFPPPDGAM